MNVISEYVYNDIKLDETRNFVDNTLLEYKRKYGYNYNRTCEIKCITKFSDKMQIETKKYYIKLL